ncbi:MAG: LysR family transcriptional regulator [Beijerinckiaceae bacterium]|nr:MAG: LysR family transcriptional regulator [Beijerinckiaceae bacterium]
MRWFAVTAESASLASAARKLGLSPATVSRGLTELETRLGAKLVERTTRSLALTEQGRLFQEDARRILVEIEAAEEALSARQKAPAGRLAISAPSLLGRAWLAPLLPEFLATYPRISVDLLLLDRPVRLVEEGLDAALVVGRLESSGLIARKLGDIRMIVCAAPSYLAARGVPETPEDLAHHECLIFADAGAAPEWRFKTGGGERTTIVPPARLTSNALDVVVAAAVQGRGLVRAPLWQVAADLAAGRLVSVLENYERPPAPLHIVFTKTRAGLPKLRAFVDFIFAGRRF